MKENYFVSNNKTLIIKISFKRNTAKRFVKNIPTTKSSIT